MMTRDVMVGLVCEMYEVADTINEAEKALDNYENGGACPCPAMVRS